MQFIAYFLDVILNLDKYLAALTVDYGLYVYLILFLIIFFETGVVLTPFLPGDSLLFAAGTLAAIGSLDIKVLAILLMLAAIVGDNLNYSIGRFIGKKMFEARIKNDGLIRKEHLKKTEDFFEKYGEKTIIIARFAPIIRTMSPFLAGIGNMNYMRFLSYDILGAFLWINAFLFGGYYFGNIELVKQNLSFFIILIVIVSLLPIAKEILLTKKLPK